jgi:hypothetical protein
MSKTKEHYHDEINQGVQYREVPEPYIFKFICYFNYMSKPYTLFADSLTDLEELASTTIGQPVLLNHGPKEGEYVFMFEHWDLPVQLIHAVNPHY